MARRSESKTFLRKHWAKALSMAHILFAEEGYHTRYLDEIEAFIGEATETAVPPAPAANSNGEETAQAALSPTHEHRYRVDHYPYSRFWVEDLERDRATHERLGLWGRQHQAVRNTAVRGPG